MNLRVALIIVWSLSFRIAVAQTETPASKSAIASFQQYYNAGAYDSIFARFSEATKTALPLDKTTAFLSHLNKQFGTIRNTAFMSYKNGFAVYKAALEKGTILLQLATDQNDAITGLFAQPYAPDTLRNKTPMHLPFKGEWTVFWGGDTQEQNYHVVVPFQKNAFDIVINNKEGRSYKTDGKTNDDYYAFGQPILAPCDGEIVMAVDGVKDNVPGVMNALYIPGNAILLKTKDEEYILLAHFKRNSVKVKQGDVVKQGQLLGLCGNSGNSSEPHLHFHIQHVEDFSHATGIKCYFEKLTVNGVLKNDYSPVKGDRIMGDE
ncbi:MAG: peptidoglycan DD-metalloendopeptidase family protein [Chitinophaga sp.]|uniref:peptidoglycan DD-metalloendopeptidase family protein n=1 Tax=Chitinophaga sp. TaxID=1869181 RepID=UPI001B0F11E3|nr:peptidoglycan DD-metalloendopeptidase family protein [Chitinophaga sp.]MBO9731408.1 peptidoglycan DD-metalloendopeptidase family protein [Chitinophaga sp.]